MDSKDEANADGHRLITASENSDTMALQKKRARRVSFAEMTSVHFFDRDDEYNETPLTETAKIIDDSSGELEFSGQPESNKELVSEDDGDELDEDDEMEMRRSFLRPVGSPSPGGSTFGSASSNDEDNFFGPVSANFIRIRRLSGSAASDDNHDVTMDSTAFSMHYRSLARSESGVDLKTPTAGQLFFEEKTPTNPSLGSSMVFTLGRKSIPRSSALMTEVSGSRNSNDMSLVGENPNKYDYDKLSPGLDALLAESSRNLLSVSVSDDIITSVSPKWKEGEVVPSIDDGDNIANLSHSARKEAGWVNSPDVPNGDESVAPSKLREANGRHGTSPSGRSPKRISSSVMDAAASNRDSCKANRSPYQLSNGKFVPKASESETSLVACTSSSSPVRQQILLTTASPSKYSSVASPLPEKPGSLLRNESVDHQEPETSIQKSISKLESLENSAFTSAFSAKVDKSTIKSLDFLKSPNFDSFLEKSHNISRINLVEDSVTEETLTSSPQSKERTYVFSMDHSRAETPNHISGENHLEERLGPIMSGTSLKELNAKNMSMDQAKNRATSASPSKITWSGNNLMRSLFKSKHSDEDALMAETESLLAEIASNEGGKTVLTTNVVSSPGRMLENKLSASPGFQSSQSKNLLPQSQFQQISDFDKGQDSIPERNLADVGEVNISNRREIFGIITNFSSPAKENRSQDGHSKIVDVVNQTSMEISTFEDAQPGEEFSGVFHGSVSPSAVRNLDEPRLQNPVEFPTASPFRKELDGNQSPRIRSPQTTQLSGRLENFSATKRNVELLLRDTQHRTEMTIVQRSPKLQKGGNCEPEARLYPNEGGKKITAHERKSWTETYSKYSEDIKNLICGPADVLNCKMIDALEVMLIYQQKSKIYEMLHVGVMPQNTSILHDLQLEKIAETNTLLHRVVFEKAKLQLKYLKRETLLKRLQLFGSRILELKKLREDMLSQPSKTRTTKILAHAVDDQTLSINSKKGHEVCPEKLTGMRQALEALDRKVSNLMRTFHASCKMKSEPSCVDTLSLVNEHLIQRASCRFIRLDMQMWVVHSVATENGQHNVVLNYLDFIIQRFPWKSSLAAIKIIVSPTSNATTSFKLNEANIIKNFPNMDASIAFAFVFNAETSCKYIGAKTLLQKTQVTSSLLGTLLDVVEEVQLARIEFQNLTQSGFSSPSVEQLDLMLCFFNFNSGMKVILRLDISCLKRGIYPSDIIPLQLASAVDSQKSSLRGPIFDEIRDTVKGVRTGYMRILRLCRCISQVVQASTA